MYTIFISFSICRKSYRKPKHLLNEIAEFIICGKRGWYHNILCGVTNWPLLGILLHTMTWERSKARHWSKLYWRADFTDINSLIKLQPSLKKLPETGKTKIYLVFKSTGFTGVFKNKHLHEDISSMLSIAQYFPYIAWMTSAHKLKSLF